MATPLGRPLWSCCALAVTGRLSLLSGVLISTLLATGCDDRVFVVDDDGIGETGGETDSETGSGSESGTDDTDTDTGTDDEPIVCSSTVHDLAITDTTDPASVECVTKVFGDLVIGPSIDLGDLSMLGNLRDVGGTFYIAGNLGLTSLAGLDELDSVGWLHIRRNGSLVDLGGLASLGEVERISVVNNDALVTLAGLPDGLAPAELDIAENDMLEDLDGLPVFLAAMSGEPIDIEVEDHESLTNLGGLGDCCSGQPVTMEIARNESLVELDGLQPFLRFEILRLVDNRALADVSAIDATEIGTFEVSYDHCSTGPTPVLVDFLGLELGTVDVLIVEWAESLASFAGLESLVGVTELRVRNNAALEWQGILDLQAQTSPSVVDACGGIGGPECVNEVCPTY